MILAVHQPQYLPWLGYFDKLDRADVFCFLDNVQYKKNEWQNRNRIKSAAGWQWLTVPVSYRFPQLIIEVSINNTTNWRRKHLQALITNYGKSLHFSQIMEDLAAIYEREWHSLCELNIAVIECLRNLIGLSHKKTIRASEYDLSEDPNDRLVDLCELVGAGTYLAGAGGAAYMDLKPFKKRGIKVIFQDFFHPVYPQQFGEFLPQLSTVDLLFNCGTDSLRILRGQPC
jgi:hypothetical protein